MQQFVALFSYRWESLVKETKSTAWRKVSRLHYLTDEEVLESVRGQSRLMRSVCFDDKTRFAVMSIPASSQYHNVAAIAKIRQVLACASVQLKHYQGQNEEWYLYIHFSQWADTNETSKKLARLLEQNGFILGAGVLEVHSTGTKLPLPLQESFIWLNEQCQLVVRRDELSIEQALAAFLSDIEQSAIDPGKFIAGISTALESGQIAAPVANRTMSRQSKQMDEIVQTENVFSALQRKPIALRQINKPTNTVQLALPIGNLAACGLPGEVMPRIVGELETRPPP